MYDPVLLFLLYSVPFRKWFQSVKLLVMVLMVETRSCVTAEKTSMLKEGKLICVDDKI